MLMVIVTLVVPAGPRGLLAEARSVGAKAKVDHSNLIQPLVVNAALS